MHAGLSKGHRPVSKTAKVKGKPRAAKRTSESDKHAINMFAVFLRRGYFIIVQQTNTFLLMALNRLIKVTADSIATESPSLSASSFSNSPFCCEYIVDNHDVNRNELSSVLQKMIKDLHL